MTRRRDDRKRVEFMAHHFGGEVFGSVARSTYMVSWKAVPSVGALPVITVLLLLRELVYRLAGALCAKTHADGHRGGDARA